MEQNTEKQLPSSEAKALSLFLMAYKNEDPSYKVQSKRMNKLWSNVQNNKITNKDYMKEVQKALTSFGGYSEVIEKTILFYIETTGEWKSKGNDKYAKDAKLIADRIMKKS